MSKTSKKVGRIYVQMKKREIVFFEQKSIRQVFFSMKKVISKTREKVGRIYLQMKKKSIEEYFFSMKENSVKNRQESG